jgi:Fe2+ or Zn2+ uptake regulation protein
VIEFSDCGVDRLARSLAKRTRFLIEDHSIELYGRCPTCRGRSQAAPPTRDGRPGGR